MQYSCTGARLASVSSEIIQVRDVPFDDARILRARASARGQSLSAYLRELIHADASQPAMDEVLTRIAGRKPVDVEGDVIRVLIEDGRR